MVRVPLPQEIRRIPGTGGFGAPAIVGPRRAAGRGIQINRLGRAMLSAGLTIFEEANKRDLRVAVIQAKKGQALLGEAVFEKVRAFKNLVGTDAVENADAAREAIAKAGEEIGAGLPPAARDVFNDNLSRMLLSARASIAAHEDREIRAAADGTSTALIGTTMDLARAQALDPAPPQEEQAQQDPQRIRVPGDPEELKPPDFAKTLRAEARNRAINRYGSGATEQINREVTEVMTALHSGVIDDMVDRGESTRAGEYLAGNDGEMTGGALNRSRDQIRTGSVQEESASRAAELVADLAEMDAALTGEAGGLRSQDISDVGLAQVQAMGESGEISIPVRNGMRAEIARIARERQAQEANARGDIMERFIRWRAGNPHAPLRTAPPTLLRDLDRNDLEDDAVRYSNVNGNFRTDTSYMVELQSGRSADFQKEFETFKKDAALKLSPNDLALAVQYYNRANALPEDFSLTGDAARVKDFAEQTLKLDLDDEGGQLMYGRLRREVESQGNAAQARTKQPLSRDQLNEILGTIASDIGFFPEFGFDDPVPLALLSDEELRGAHVIVDVPEMFGLTRVIRKQRVDLDQMTSAETDLITEKLRAKGLPTDMRSIARHWLKGRGQ